MAERNILAYFHSPEEAEEAKRKLESLRVVDCRIDRFSAFPGEGATDLISPVTGNFSGLGDLSLDGEFANKSEAILAAAHPDASGMSDGSREPAGLDILLTAVVEESDYERALRIVADAGGQI